MPIYPRPTIKDVVGIFVETISVTTGCDEMATIEIILDTKCIVALVVVSVSVGVVRKSPDVKPNLAFTPKRSLQNTGKVYRQKKLNIY